MNIEPLNDFRSGLENIGVRVIINTATHTVVTRHKNMNFRPITDYHFLITLNRPTSK